MILRKERLQGLDKRIIACVEEFHNRTKNQYDTLIVFGFRSVEEQDALFAQGRLSLDIVNLMRESAEMNPITAEENKKVTKAKGGQSAHNFHAAVDVVGELLHDLDKEMEWTDMDYFTQLKQVADEMGLATLWSIGDYGHVETPDWKK